MQITKIFSKTFLNTPYHRVYKPWKSMAISTSVVMLILFMVSPWGRLPLPLHLLTTACSGLIIALVESVFYFAIPRIAPAWHAEERWTIGKDILALIAMLFSIAIAECAFFVIVFGMPATPLNIGIFMLFFLLLVPFPTAIGYLWQQNLNLKRNLILANEMNEEVLRRQDETLTPYHLNAKKSSDNVLTIPDGKNNLYSFDPEQLLYVSSEGNYINIVVKAEDERTGKTEEKMLRTTMKSIEDILAPYDYIVRCHRSYLVNLNHIQMVTGNAQECLIRLIDCKDTVPVSRNFRKEILKMVQGE